MAKFNEQEQKAKNERIYKRGNLVEKLLPELIPLTQNQFDTFVEKVLLTNYTRRIIKELISENEIPADPKTDTDTAQDGNVAAAKPVVSAARNAPAPTQKTAGAA